MYAFLLILGAVTTVAGLTIVGWGVAAHDAAAIADVIAPGTTAAVGGLILVGLALVVRGLRRVERVLALRPMPRSLRPSEAPAPPERSEAPSRIPFPPKPRMESRPPPVPPAAVDKPRIEELAERSPTAIRLDGAPVLEEQVSLLPPARAEEELTEVRNVSVAGGTEKVTPVAASPRAEVETRSSGAPRRDRASMLEAFWPSGQRVKRDSQPALALAVAPPSAMQPEQNGEPVPAARPAPVDGQFLAAAGPVSAAPVSILKSGVVEGMAYTLYSDGSIEAQLPQGTLRFASITELRNHIENAS